MPTPVQIQNAKLFKQLLERSNIRVDTAWEYRRLKALGYMDLSIDQLAHRVAGKWTRFAMAHNNKLNGDVMADPDMEFDYYFAELPYIVAHHYQNDYVGVFTSVERGNTTQRNLDDFLHMWLNNLIEQGHVTSEVDADVAST